MEAVTIDLARLKPWPKNPRTEMAGICELASSIVANGLLQPLVVAPNADSYYVIAGNRRLAALRELDRPSAPCLVVDPAIAKDEDALMEIALTENVMRAPMHPMDECEAFGRIAGEGKNLTAIAEAFGVTERYVRQRMALAALPERARAAFRAGEIGIGEAKALASLEDAKQADKVLKNALKAGGNVRWAIERAAAADGERFYTKVAAFDVAASGLKIAEDLFDEDDDGNPSGPYFVDPEKALKAQVKAMLDMAETAKQADPPPAFVTVLKGSENFYTLYRTASEKDKPAKVGLVFRLVHGGAVRQDRAVHLQSERANDRKAVKATKEKAKKAGKADGELVTELPNAFTQDLRELHRLALAVFFASHPDEFAKATNLLPMSLRVFTGHKDVAEIGARVRANLDKMTGLAPRIAAFIEGFGIDWNKLPWAKKLNLGDLPWPRSMIERLPRPFLETEAKALKIKFGPGTKKAELVEKIWKAKPAGWVPVFAKL